MRVEPSASLAVTLLSDGRCRGARLLADPNARFQREGPVVLVPGSFQTTAELLCGIALQCSPSKEAVVDLPIFDGPVRLRRAASWVEGAIALGWATGRWPLLRQAFNTLIPQVRPRSWDGDMDSLAAAITEAVRRGAGEPPQLFGLLPGIPNASVRHSVLRRVEARLPWTFRRPRERGGVNHIPVAGDGGSHQADAAQGCAPDAERDGSTAPTGFVYDEWDIRRVAYRRGWVRVLESGGGRADGAQLLAPTRAVILPPDRSRHWVGGLDDGADLDVDAYVEQYLNPNEDGAAACWYGQLRPSAGRLAVGLLVDGSASIRDRTGSPLRAQLMLARRLGASLDTRGDPWGAFVFRSHSRSRVEVIVAKDFCSPRPLVVSPDAARPSGATRLGAGLRHVTRRLLAVPAEFRALVSMGDAKPYDEGYEGRYADADVRRAVEEARTQGVTVFHLSVTGHGDRGESLFGRGRHLRVRNDRDLHAALARIYEQLEE